ncbi:DNA primase [Thermosulfurimonas sp. F29]|uniref:DNA primase n=1 Tax=Thermosulfurimonas sp. F29 TaxID=2867247 RepID=UPI001C82F3DD|nr:DNA primase [Thermosulfurimonas sp. F29]MBX6422842.1 DNA primase [Thermosulfurimonas sp. F29]
MNLREAAARIRDTVNIVDLVSDYVALKKVGRNYMGLCPFHSETKPSFAVNEEKQIFRCFGCGAGGDVIGFFMRAEGLTFAEAVRELARRYNLPLPEGTGESSSEERHRLLYEINEKAARFYGHLLNTSSEAEEAREHLRERGLSPETVKTFRLGFAPEEGGALASHLRLSGVDLARAEEAGVVVRREDGSYYDRFRKRLIFPIRNAAGKTVALAGRILGEGDPKYLNSPETPIYRKSRVLYGLYEARVHVREKGTGLVVEGYFDLLSLWDRGVRNVMATCGTALTQEHVRLLRRLCRNWYLVFDGDEAGRKAAARALAVFFREGVFPRVVFLPEGEDPDSLVRRAGIEALEELLASALEPLSFLVDHLRRLYGDDPQGKSATARELREILSGIPDPVARHEYLRLAAERLRVPEDLLLSARPRTSSPERPVSSDDPFGRLILQVLLHLPSCAARLKRLGVEEFLSKDTEKRLYARIMEAVEEGRSPENLTLDDPELQDLYGELLFSPPPEKPEEEVLSEIERTVTLRRFRKMDRLIEEIRQAESMGKRETLARLLRAYAEICKKSLNCRGEGAYESFSQRTSGF